MLLFHYLQDFIIVLSPNEWIVISIILLHILFHVIPILIPIILCNYRYSLPNVLLGARLECWMRITKWIIIFIIMNEICCVEPKNLWPWPIFTLGPKARAEEGYSRGRVIKIQVVLRHSRGWFCPRHIRGPPERKGKNGIGTVLGKT